MSFPQPLIEGKCCYVADRGRKRGVQCGSDIFKVKKRGSLFGPVGTILPVCYSHSIKWYNYCEKIMVMDEYIQFMIKQNDETIRNGGSPENAIMIDDGIHIVNPVAPIVPTNNPLPTQVSTQPKQSKQRVRKNKYTMPRHIADQIYKAETECSICLEHMVIENLSISKCGHIYCNQCYSKIIDCAVCKGNLYID